MINAYLVDPIIIMKSTASPGWGEPGVFDEKEVMGKIEYKTKLIKDLTGEQVVAGTAGAAMASAMVMLSANIEKVACLGRALNHEDRLKFKEGAIYVEHTILKIEMPKAFSDPHYEVWVA